MKTKNVVAVIIILSLGVALWLTSKARSRNRKYEYSSTFKGIIIKKKYYRGILVYYKDLSTNKIDDIYATSELGSNSDVGDTIIKLPNSNNCILKNGRKNISLKCHFELDDMEYSDK